MEESTDVDECEGGPPRADLRGAGVPISPEPLRGAFAVGTNGGREGDKREVVGTPSDAVRVAARGAEASPKMDEKRSPMPVKDRETGAEFGTGVPAEGGADRAETAAPGPDFGTHGTRTCADVAKRRWKNPASKLKPAVAGLVVVAAVRFCGGSATGDVDDSNAMTAFETGF